MASGGDDFHKIPAAIICLTRITSYATRRHTVRAVAPTASSYKILVPRADRCLPRFPLLALRQQLFEHAHVGRFYQVMIELDPARVTTYFVLTVSGHCHQ